MEQTIGELNVEFGARFNKLDAAIDKLGGKLKQVDKQASVTGGMLDKIGPVVAAAFATQKITAFVTESVKLAGKLQGVEAAFDRLNNPALMDELRGATQGTVSDLNLMQNAVRAASFKIPLEELGTLFEFARRRAKETGEDVDYLVNSIVTGIGRKSPMILDNLGISSTALSDKLNGAAVASSSIGTVTKAVGEIAREELASMGDEVITTQDKMDRLSASTDNLKAAVGTALTPAVNVLVVALADLNEHLTKAFESIGEQEFTWGERIGGFIAELGLLGPAFQSQAEAQLIAVKAGKEFQKQEEASKRAAEQSGKALDDAAMKVGDYKAAIEELKMTMDQATTGQGVAKIASQIAEMERALDRLFEIRDEQAIELPALSLPSDMAIDTGAIDGTIGKTKEFDAAWSQMNLSLAENATQGIEAMRSTEEAASALDVKFENSMSVIYGFGDSLAYAFSQQWADGALSFGEVIGDVLKRMVTQFLAAAAAAAVLSAIMGPLLGGSALGSALGLGGADLSFGSLFKDFAGFRAEGGPVKTGKSYVVGERGPEIFTPTSTGSIIPNTAMSAAGGYGGGGAAMGGTLTTSISGYNLDITLSRSRKVTNRITGT